MLSWDQYWHTTLDTSNAPFWKYLPMVPELPITMLACARLGIIHSEVFRGFSGEACGLRIADSQSRVLITIDGYCRSGKVITGHSYIVYGPLAIAATSVIYEGVPIYPDAGRPWRIAERLGVNVFHTSPTPIRMLRKAGPVEPTKYNHHFKHMTTVGEPIEPDVWRWLVDQVQFSQCTHQRFRCTG